MNPGTSETPFPIPPNWRWSQIAEIGVLSPRNEASDSTEASFVPMPLIAAEYGVDQIEARTRSSAASGRFTADGVKDDALNFTMSNLIPVFHRARTTIRKAKAEVAERRSRLKIEGPDKSDVAGAFRRREIRTFLREMKGNDQKNYFARYGDNLPGEVTMAILEMPPEFSGVPKSRHDLLTTKALEAQHGAEIAEIAELEEAIVSAESTVEIGRDEVRLEVGVLDERKFNEMAAPIEAKHDAPWLKRSKGPNGAEEIRVVDLDRMRPIPITAWVPLSLIFFGFDFKNAVFLVALGSFFPIVVNTIEGVRGVNKSLVKVGRMVGARRLKLLWFFVLPASLPSIFVGLRLGIGLAWVLVIVAELLSVKNGIGYTLLDAYSFNRFDVVIAAMIMLGVMGFLSDRIILGIQKIFLRWHYEVSIHAE